MAPFSKYTVLRAGALISILLLGILLISTQWSYHMSHSVPVAPPTSSLGGYSQLTANTHVVAPAVEEQDELIPDTPAGEAHTDKDKELKDVRLKYSLLRKSYLDPDPRFSHSEQLGSTYVPPIVHYVWCGARWFWFKEYLSIMSVIREVRPDSITVHYDTLPTIDKKFYHWWIDELKFEYPFFSMQPLGEKHVNACHTELDRSQKLSFVNDLLREKGGMYVSFNTWMLRFNPRQRDTDLEFAIDDNSLDGYVIQRASTENLTHEEMLRKHKVNSRQSSCVHMNHFYEHGQNATCLILHGKQFQKDFYPMNIWDLDDPFGRAARKIFYGTPEIRMPEPSYDELVPNIGHMIWIGGRGMDFVFYLSALSVLYVVNVDMLYIHGDVEPAGEYWPQLKQNERVKFILRSQPNWVYQGEIDSRYKSLMSDIIRCDLMIKYGGIYTDTDAIWVKPLTYEERGYDAVASYDWIDWSYPFQDSVNMGVSFGKRNAPFWQIFRESMRVLHNTNAGYTGVQMPYKLLEKYPHLLRIDRHLSVICYKFRCHPTWVKNYHDIKNDHVTSNSIPNWREDVHAFHWTHPNPTEYANMSTLLNSKGLFAEIGLNVLEKAGLIPKDDAK